MNRNDQRSGSFEEEEDDEDDMNESGQPGESVQYINQNSQIRNDSVQYM